MPDTAFITLAEAAALAINACARAYQTDGREMPADADNEALWPPVYDAPEYD